MHDYETGEELLCNKGHHGPVYGCRFTPDGKTYASGGDDGTIRFWTWAEAESAEAYAAENMICGDAVEEEDGEAAPPRAADVSDPA